MKSKDIKIRIKSLSEALSDFKDAFEAARSETKIAKREGVYFAGLGAVRSVLTENRLQLLRVIKKRKPNSIYELAQTVQRDLKNVHQDLQLLAELGLIEFERRASSKEKAPRVRYDEIRFRVAV